MATDQLPPECLGMTRECSFPWAQQGHRTRLDDAMAADHYVFVRVCVCVCWWYLGIAKVIGLSPGTL